LSRTVVVPLNRSEPAHRVRAFARRYRVVMNTIGAIATFVALCCLFLAVLHPWLMNWGSTRDEQVMVLPGDVEPPSSYFTRAITINVAPDRVWPWLMQIGQDRAGFYSNDYLENLTSADIHNAALRSSMELASRSTPSLMPASCTTAPSLTR
jgi:hypothetical protein